MYKKMFAGLTFLALAALSGSVQAQYCGGELIVDNDCSSNARTFAVSCCPKGYRVHGIAYNDMANSDYADAVAPVCRHVVKGNDLLPTDFQTQPVTHVCEKTEIVIGVACKDMPKKGGMNSDILDGCTAICWNPTTKKERMLYSQDLEGNGRPYVIHKVDFDATAHRLVGVVYKDLDKGAKGDSGHDSDRADCASVVHKHLPIVK